MIEGIIKVKDAAVIWENKLDTLINSIGNDSENEGKSFEVSVKPISNRAGHYLHKYYRGFLIPAIADEAYSGDEDEAHYAMKEMFLKYEVKSLSELPVRHRSNAFKAQENVDVNVFVRYICIPSTSTLTQPEFKAYIAKIENLALDFMQLNLDKTAIEARQKGFKNEY